MNYKTIDGSITLTTGRALFSHVLVDNELGLTSEYSPFAEAMYGEVVLFRNLEDGDSPLREDFVKVIWSQSAEDLIDAEGTRPEITKTLRTIFDWDIKDKGRGSLSQLVPPLFLQYAPLYISEGEVVTILPRSYMHRHETYYYSSARYERLLAETGIRMRIIKSDILPVLPVAGITPPTINVIDEEIFNMPLLKEANCNLGATSFGDSCCEDWAECVNFHMYNHVLYNKYVLPYKQRILQAFREKFGVVPNIRFTFGS